MNYSVIRKILGKLAILLASLMLLPLIVSLIYKEGIRHYLSFLIPCLVLILIGCLLNIKKVTNYKMQVREGTIIVGLAWLLMSLIGAIPFMISKEIPNFFDAFFESASGFTTTGASIVTDVWYYGSTAPDNGKTGSARTKARKLLWIDSNTSTGGLKYFNGSSWVHVPVAWQ